MEIGISTGFFYEQDLIETLPIIHQAGFKFIELWAGASGWGQYTHYNWHERKYTMELKKKLQEFGMRVWSVHAPFSETMDLSNLVEQQRKSAVEECCKLIETLKILQSEILVIHPAVKTFDLKDSQLKEKRIAQAKKSVGEIAETARAEGCRIAIENLLPHILGGETEVLFQLLKDRQGDSLGICFDSSHANLWKEPKVEAYLKTVSPYLMATHFSDNYGLYDDHHPPGDGEINWKGILQILKESGYQGVFMLEVLGESRSRDPSEILPTTYQRTQEFLQQAGLL